MIKISQVSKKFGKKEVLHNISFKTSEGEIIGFLGPNGAGKTTTMRIIVGFYKPTMGEVEIDGMNPFRDRIKVLSNIGYLPENNPLYYEVKVREYLQFIATIKNSNDDELKKIAKDVKIGEVWENKIGELSRGFKQRVGLSAALLGDPKILVLDEPTSGLDPIEQEKIRTLIKTLGKKKTIILSTHILSEVEDIATRVIIIDKGKIVYDDKKPKGKGAVEKLFRKLVK